MLTFVKILHSVLNLLVYIETCTHNYKLEISVKILTVSLGISFIVVMYALILTSWIFIADIIHFEKNVLFL